MKTNRSMTRSLGTVALRLFAAVTVPNAQADAIQPRFRIEDLGPTSNWGGDRLLGSIWMERFIETVNSPVRTGISAIIEHFMSIHQEYLCESRFIRVRVTPIC